MIKSDSINKIIPALLSAQMEFKKAKKNNSNSHFKSKFADLESVVDCIKEPLNKHSIVYSQIVTPEGVETILFHTSGEYFGGLTPVIVARPNDPQALGSAITYAKRYGLAAITGLATEDDDGESAMDRDKDKKKDVKVPYSAYKETPPVYNGAKYTAQPGMQDVGY